MKPFVIVLAFLLIGFAGVSCTSNSGGGGGTYYAPEPESSVNQTARMQDQFGSITRSGIR